MPRSHEVTEYLAPTRYGSNPSIATDSQLTGEVLVCAPYEPRTDTKSSRGLGRSWPDTIAGLRRGCEAARQAHRRYFRHLQADWSKGPAMVTGEADRPGPGLGRRRPMPLTFPTSGMPAGLAGRATCRASRD